MFFPLLELDKWEGFHIENDKRGTKCVIWGYLMDIWDISGGYLGKVFTLKMDMRKC